MEGRLGAQLKSQPAGQRAFEGTFEALLDRSKHAAVVNAVLAEDAIFSDYVQRLVDNGLGSNSSSGSSSSSVDEVGNDNAGSAAGSKGATEIVLNGESVLLLNLGGGGDGDSIKGSVVVNAGVEDGSSSGPTALVVQFPSVAEKLHLRHTVQLEGTFRWLLGKVEGNVGTSSAVQEALLVADIPSNDPFEKVAVAHELLRIGIATVKQTQKQERAL